MLLFSKIWLFCKKYYAIVLIVATTLIALFLGRKSTSLFEELQKQKEINDELLRKLEASKLEREKESIKNEQKLQEDLTTIQAQYKKDKEELIIAQEKKVQELSQESVEELAEKFKDSLRN